MKSPKTSAGSGSASCPNMFSVSQAFEVPFERGPNGFYFDPADDCKKFFRGEANSFRDQVGCYVFAMRAGRGFQPWYVGKTNKSFGQECFQHHKITNYVRAVNLVQKGTPVMFFVSPETGKATTAIIKEMETYLIQQAYQKNPALLNVQHAKGPAWGIRGVKNSPKGKPSREARPFKTMMGIH